MASRPGLAGPLRLGSWAAYRGLELALACDLRVAARKVQLGLTETRLAIIPGAGGTVSLSRRIGRQRTAELALTGRTLGVDEARTLGLVDQVSPIQCAIRLLIPPGSRLLKLP